MFGVYSETAFCKKYVKITMKVLRKFYKTLYYNSKAYIRGFWAYKIYDNPPFFGTEEVLPLSTILFVLQMCGKNVNSFSSEIVTTVMWYVMSSL